MTPAEPPPKGTIPPLQQPENRAPSDYLVIDWIPTAGLQCFCAVLAWSRVRFVRFALEQRRAGRVSIVHGGVEIARQALVLPGEVASVEAHYGGPASRPRRGVRPRTLTELAFFGLGPLC